MFCHLTNRKYLDWLNLFVCCHETRKFVCLRGPKHLLTHSKFLDWVEIRKFSDYVLCRNGLIKLYPITYQNLKPKRNYLLILAGGKQNFLLCVFLIGRVPRKTKLLGVCLCLCIDKHCTNLEICYDVKE